MVSFSRNLVVKSLADTETKIQTDTTETSRPIENPKYTPKLPVFGAAFLYDIQKYHSGDFFLSIEISIFDVFNKKARSLLKFLAREVPHFLGGQIF